MQNEYYSFIIAGHSLQQSENISLRCFRNLQALELLHIPVTNLKALQTLRPTLRSIIIFKGLTRLADLFIRCGADKVKSDCNSLLLQCDPSFSMRGAIEIIFFLGCR